MDADGFRPFPSIWSRWFCLFLTVTAVLLETASSESSPDDWKVVIKLPNVTTNKEDAYMTAAFDLQKLLFKDGKGHGKAYVFRIRPIATAKKSHHVLLFACDKPFKKDGEGVWDSVESPLCLDFSTILYGWARDACELELPGDVSIPLSTRKKRYLVLQVHYAIVIQDPDSSGLELSLSEKPTKHLSGIYLLVKNNLRIPANTPKVHGDVACKVSRTFHPFAFRSHAHQWCYSVVGYRYSAASGQVEEIARGNPQWPQAFYPIRNNVTLRPGDFIFARCNYNTTGTFKDLYIGSTHNDEMCNLYLMGYGEEGREAPSDVCSLSPDQSIVEKLPADSDALIVGGPPLVDVKNPELTTRTVRIAMPGALPETDDSYFCTAFKVADWEGVEEEAFVTHIHVDTTAAKVHHVLLQRCNSPLENPGKIWDCRHHSVCSGDTKVFYAWAKDAPPSVIPEGVGFKVGGELGYVVLQVHYAHPLPDPDFAAVDMEYTLSKPTYFGGIYLLLTTSTVLRPHLPIIHADANCALQGHREPLTLFSFRTHAHKHGTVITGYKVTNGGKSFLEVARGDPQKPQMFYPMKSEVEVNNGDVLAARCTFNTTGEDHIVRIGATAGDEMCNLYLGYYTRDSSDDFNMCINQEDPSLSARLPADSDWSMDQISGSKEIQMPYDNGFPSSAPGGRQKKQHGFLSSKKLHPVPNWPSDSTKARLGQVCGISIDVYGNPTILHRVDRKWTADTFDVHNNYAGNKDQPIAKDTVLTVDSEGNVQNSWGSNMFHLPHHITVDNQNNVWITDVALHQVFKFLPYGGNTKKAVVVLGQRFQPGSDDLHYCKPTTVAVESDGKTVFVSDGYCNSRIIKYSLQIDSAGNHNMTKLLSWGRPNQGFPFITQNPYSLNVPHDLVLAEDKGLICVADRENGRVQCYRSASGEFAVTVKPSEFGSTIYGISYCPANGGVLFAVGGPEPLGLVTGKQSKGYLVDIDDSTIINTFNTESGFGVPHGIAVNKNGSEVYVVDLEPRAAWKFTYDNSIPTVPTQPVVTDDTQQEEDPKGTVFVHWVEDWVPASNVGVVIALVSLSLTICCVLCAWISRWRKRGGGGSRSAKKVKSGLHIGDILGRSKNGFQPLRTADDEGELLSSDSDVEEFSVPSLQA